jgi:ABC-type multidrug transport system permease subunit
MARSRPTHPGAETTTPAAARIEVGRPRTGAMIWQQLRHANRGFWRSPIAAFFTIVFPLLFLVLLGALIGNQTIGDTGVRVAQFLTPAIAAFAATTASFTSLAIGLVIEREEGILKRVRGTPVSPWMFMAARIGSSVWIALVSVALMLTVGVLFFGVQLIGRTAPAALLTLLVGIGCFAALGLAVVALSPSQSATQAITNAVILPLAFVSDIFTQGDLPAWLETVGWVFPLKHFANALGDTFNPFETGSQFGWDHLAVMAAWGLAGALVALWRFRWEPRPAGRSRGRGAGAFAMPGTTVALGPATRHGRPGVASLIAAQTWYATRAFLRNPASAFFIVGFPVILLLLLPVVFGNGQLPSRGGIPLTQFLAPVLAVYGAATAAYGDFSQRVAFARDRGVLKRIHGTPLPVWAFLVGRILTAICVALASLVLTMAVGMLAHGVELVPRALPGLLVSVVLGIACFAALGLAIAALAPNAEAVPTIANATLLPLAFFSDIFIIGDGMPRWMEVVGTIFPLKHFANAVADSVNPTIPGAGFFPDHLAVMALWSVVGLMVALRFWTWEPRERAPRRSRRRTSRG